jgi:hypothetical protein
MALVIRNHAELQGAVVRATLAGGAYGLVHWLWPGPAAFVLGVVAIGIAAVPPRSWRSAALAASVAVLAGAASALGGVAGALACAAVGGQTFARGLSGRGRRSLAAIGGALGLAAGWFVERALGGSDAVSGIAPALAGMLLGGATGFVASLGATGRQLDWRPARALPPKAASPAHPALEGGGEIAGLLARAQSSFIDARMALGECAPEARAAAADLLGRIERFARHWHELEREATRTDRAELSTRLTSIESRVESASDEVVRAEYSQAHAALAEQLSYLDGIERGRDRAVARLHHHVAVLERLRLAALHHRSADAARVGEELAPLVEDLTSAGRDLDYAAEALAELPAPSMA